jgi:hypothetical protein
LAEEKTDMEPQKPFMMVTASAKRKFLRENLVWLRLVEGMEHCANLTSEKWPPSCTNSLSFFLSSAAFVAACPEAGTLLDSLLEARAFAAPAGGWSAVVLADACGDMPGMGGEVKSGEVPAVVSAVRDSLRLGMTEEGERGHLAWL